MPADSTSLEGLRAEWRERFMTAPPKLRSRDLLAREIAYRDQVARHGGLSRTLDRRLCRLAERFAENGAFEPSLAPKIKQGSCFVKHWRGDRHEVWVKDEGYHYRGRDFASLSQVAFVITGTKWNGPAFFGQRKPVKS
ncbi:DUF2924 domain-containing protein [Brevundimonas sp. SL161]|uniref:DUF2924 domain-containing protein n=1 Tax=Brevundimonas sp. SL161 TaxID=2804613 RepID=UPI003CFB3E4D